MTSAPSRASPSSTLETLISLPGIGCELRITVSCGVSFNQRLSPAAINDSADMASPCEPVEMMHTFPGGRSATSAISRRFASGMCNRPISRASRTLFCIDRPNVATTRSNATAASAICCTRWTWLAKHAVMIRRPLFAWNRSKSTLPTVVSEREWPCSHALVESDNNNRTPSRRAIAPIVARSVRRPSTGFRSSLKSPECKIVPCGVWNAVANPCGTECVTGMNSQSNGPNTRRSLSDTVISSVRLRRPASSMRLRAKPSANAEPMIGNDNSRSKNDSPPMWSSWPWVTMHPSMRSRRSYK